MCFESEPSIDRGPMSSDRKPVYEAPKVTELGSLHELTLGTTGGSFPDQIQPAPGTPPSP